jgi:hypothetical protein
MTESTAPQSAMRRWRLMAICCDLVIVASLVAVQSVSAVGTLSAIAAYEESTGAPPDNGGRQGLAIGFGVVVVALLLAAASIWKLSHARASGFVFYALLWLLLLVFPAVSMPEFRSGMQLLCWAGALSGIVLAIMSTRSARTDVVRIPILVWIAAISAAVFIGSLTFGYVLATMPGGVETRCVSAGPAPTALGPEWEPFEAMMVRGSVQWAPFGRVCTWTAAAGEPSMTLGPSEEGWGLTTVMASSLLIAFASTATSVARLTRRRIGA